MRVKLISNNQAKFLDIKGYRCLEQAYQKHLKKIEYLDDWDTYNKPFTSTTFRFTYDYGPCSINGRPVIIDACLDQECDVNIKVIPYNFMSGSKRVVGLKIKLLSVKI